MFKLIIALSLFLAIQAQIPGGFTDRPELIKSPATQAMVKLAVTELAKSENRELTSHSVISVATQVVNGLNFRIVFTASQGTSNVVHICTAKVYQPINGPRSVSAVECA